MSDYAGSCPAIVVFGDLCTIAFVDAGTHERVNPDLVLEALSIGKAAIRRTDNGNCVVVPAKVERESKHTQSVSGYAL